jgi:hypothetical protein
MFHIVSNDSKQLLSMNFTQQVGTEEMQQCADQIKSSLLEMHPGFCILTNLTGLEHMDPACARSIGKIMDLCASAGAGVLSSVIPDPKKDIGFSIMYSFHYGRDIPAVTHECLSDALECLAA